MKRRILILISLVAIFLTGCDHQPVDIKVDHVFLWGTLVDPEDYILSGEQIFVEAPVVAKHTGWLLKEDEGQISFETPREEVIQVKLNSRSSLTKEGKHYVDMTAVAKGHQVKYDEAKKLMVLNTFERPELAYSDITYEEHVAEFPLIWQWPEDGIKGTTVIRETGKITFELIATGEVIGTIEKNPKDFPKKDDILLAIDGEDYIVARLSEKDDRKTGEAPSDKSYAIDGILSVLTSVNMPKAE